ncbi:hypothetical protein GCM10027030_17190 [Luteococcus sediminum]
MALLCFLLAVPAALVAPAGDAEALTVDPMTRTGTHDVHGDFILVGNGVLTATTNSVYGRSPLTLFTGSTYADDANDFYTLRYTDTDANASTVNSGSATYTIPDGATVVAAKLVWSGNTGTTKGIAGTTCSSDTSRQATLPPSPLSSSPSTQRVTYTVNGQTSTAASSGYTEDLSQAALGATRAHYYSANADITSAFAAVTGDGTVKTITVGNVWTPQGYGCYGGWALQMVYDFGSYETAQPDASQRRMIYLYDGYERKFSGDPATNITLTGLQPQGTGAKLGTVAFEGDATIAGDTISYSDTTSPMTELLNPVTNRTGNYFVGRADGAVPHYAVGTRTFYNASVNATTASLPNLVAGDSTLPLSVRTTGDSFLLTNEIVSVPVADIKITKTAANGEQDAAYAPGSTPSFRLTIYNSGRCRSPGSR